MTVIAVLNIVVSVIEILAGLSPLWSAFDMAYYEGWSVIIAIPAGLAAFALLLVTTGIVGIMAGIGTLRLRPWARRRSLMFGGLLLLTFIAMWMMIAIFTP